MEHKNMNEISDKSSTRHFSGVSTLCDSPQDLNLSHKKHKNPNFDARRYSLPLNKIIIQGPGKSPIEHPFKSFKVPEKLLRNDKILERFQEIRSFNPRDTFLNNSQDSNIINLEFIKLKSPENKKMLGKFSNPKKYKPSRFLPINDLNFLKKKQRKNLIGKGFEQDLNLVMQNKYEKVKADFQIEKILHLRAQTRQKPLIKNNESDWKWKTPDCTPKENKVVHF